tara:strand:- start:897 stop:1127 length:231 start_codon:yes stop_codon:yes gene_type:complete
MRGRAQPVAAKIRARVAELNCAERMTVRTAVGGRRRGVEAEEAMRHEERRLQREGEGSASAHSRSPWARAALEDLI